MNVTCSHCNTVYRVDPAKIPPAGVRARCSRCGGIIGISAPSATTPTTPTTPTPATPATPTTPTGTTGQESPAGPASSPPTPSSPPTAHAAPAPPVPAFGAADPASKARRLARALVSDIVVYHPERREQSMRDGTLRDEFRDEIRKSWDEYLGQVGDKMARETPYFRDALNEVLAGGATVF